jgi:hypothetical protein
MLNRRHKAILFITLVMTGSGLLAGARLNEALGIFLLGVAFAWVVGSQTASTTYDFLRRVPGKTWPWLKVLLLMAFGGFLLVTVAIWANFNSFLVASAMSILGMLISPFRQLPTQRFLLKVIIWGIAVGGFFLAAVGASMLSGTAQQNAERIGELAAIGLIALSIGMLWLMKGWNLIVAGISAEKAAETSQVENTANHKGTKWLHVSLFAGTIVLTLWLGLLAFSAFSDSVFPFQVKSASNQSNPISPIIFLMLLAWWPYACWKGILKREPNTTPATVKNHKRVTTLLGVLFTVVLCVSITFGIQNGNDRIATAQIEAGTKDFQDVATKIGAIKSRQLGTTMDYIDAYEEIDPLLVQFDDKLQRFTDFLAEAKQRNSNRGPFNIQKLYGQRSKEWLIWDDQMFELLRQDSALTRKQVQLAKQMATLPKENQVEFWNKNFQPLLEEEDGLRQKITSTKGSMPADTAK